MGIGRREFLRLTSLALAGVAVNPLQAVVATDDVYINKKLGVLFRKPTTWGFLNVRDFGRIKDEQILGNGWNERKEELWEDLGDPICIATKYPQDRPEYKGVFSPTITLNITPKEELTNLGYANYGELIELSNRGTAQILKDFRIVTEIRPYRICGCDFYENDAEYLFEHVDLDGPVKVELKMIRGEHNGFYYDFNCHQSSAVNEVAGGEFEALKQSIKLV